MAEIIKGNDCHHESHETGLLENDREILDILLVLEKVNALDIDVLFSKKYRNIRTALIKIYDQKLAPKMFKGLKQEEYRKRKRSKKEKEKLQFQIKCHDKVLLDKCELRKQRKDYLYNLLKNESSFSAIPDGVALVSNSLLSTESSRASVDCEVKNSLSCYQCKRRFYKLHFFYSHFCESCADLNYSKRNQSLDLSGKVALVTGSRVKIGYHVTLKLLRMGCKVIATTRFPHDCVSRFSKEPDFANFSTNLRVYGLDFKNIREVEVFCVFMKQKYERLDIIINNACQTVRRPAEFYQNLCSAERQLITNIGSECEMKPSFLPLILHDSTALNTSVSFPGNSDFFPVGMVDKNGNQIDLRSQNSWVLKLEEVDSVELIEVLAVNSVAPFIINSKLKSLLLKSKELDEASGKNDDGRYIVNVSAMEGKFYRFKNANHPHTNMAKAALNMMTRTSSEDYARVGIYMNSVDTGWVNDENPVPTASRIFKEHNFQTPIDEVDAAARILDPVLMGIRPDASPASRIFGKFLKDYRETEW